MFLVTFGLCMRALLFERDRSFIPKRWADVRVGMLLVAISMFIFATFDGMYFVTIDLRGLTLLPQSHLDCGITWTPSSSTMAKEARRKSFPISVIG